MATWKLLIVMIMYGWATYDYIHHHHYGFALMFLCYTISIVGIILAAKGV
jgi:hypothetical protein